MVSARSVHCAKRYCIKCTASNRPEWRSDHNLDYYSTTKRSLIQHFGGIKSLRDVNDAGDSYRPAANVLMPSRISRRRERVSGFTPRPGEIYRLHENHTAYAFLAAFALASNRPRRRRISDRACENPRTHFLFVSLSLSLKRRKESPVRKHVFT